MTQNDLDLLTTFRAAKTRFDNHDALSLLEDGRILGEALTNCSLYLDDADLRKVAQTAHADFGEPKDWPPTPCIPAILREAEDLLIAAISEIN